MISFRQLYHTLKEKLPVITLRMMSAVLLMNSQDELLMMKRSPFRTISPGLWAAVGGHLEPGEIGNPLAACEREILEETGIEACDITRLHLQYVLIRLNETEIRQQFFFTGLTDKHPEMATDEGELHWISRSEVFERPLPYIFRCLLEHYFQHGHTEHPWVGSAGVDPVSGQPVIHWNPLLDPYLI
jgi:8-oxo-dGTP diphosphatase